MQLDSNSWDIDFEVMYRGNRIVVRNEGAFGERLYINSILQDQNTVPDNGRLIGYIYDLNNNTEKVEVLLGGTDELECHIFADEELIFSSNQPADRAVRREEKPLLKKKRKTNIIFTFIVIVIIAVTFLIMLPYVMKQDSLDSVPAINPEQDVQDKSVADGSASNRKVDSDGNNSEMIETDYSWKYGNGTWNYRLNIPKSAYDYYKTIDRSKINSYSYYVKDTSDDEYLAGLTNKFKEAAEKENYSDMDTVNNIITFVQSLEYVSDKIGTGYDEYPKFPLETLADQGGDCEDSAILLASLLRELGYGTVLIQLPDHMAVGVRGNESVPGVYYEVDGIRYYYVETTSTGWKIGDVPDSLEGKPAQILTLD